MYSIAKNIQIVIALLKKHNINKLVLSPGGTNAPFIRGVQDDDFFKCYSVVDERSALYFAIGLYLTTGEPIAVCCTSAQATRNYIPGLTEAFYKHVPILAITFSKHYRFIGQDYMQAPNQISLPVDCVRKSYALPYITNSEDEKYCERLTNEAMLEIRHKVPAPVQLCVPMLDNELGIDIECELPEVKVIRRFSKDDVKDIDFTGKRVLIVVGENRGIDDVTIEHFAHTNNVCIYVNHLSNMRNRYTVFGNLLLSTISQNEFNKGFAPEILITIGGQTGDYPLYHKLTGIDANYEHWRISDTGDIVDTYDHLTRVYECTVDEFFRNTTPSYTTNEYFEQWEQALNNKTINIELPLSNALVAKLLHITIPEGSYVDFAILNSLRIWNLFPIQNKVKCYSNVGAFGIDGGLSTFIGQSVATDKLCFMIIGDLAFFYDMNSIGIRHIKNNIRIILINNAGGIEFKLGSTAEENKSIDRFIAGGGHYKDAEGWARSNNFDYHKITDENHLTECLSNIVKPSEKSIFIEIITTDINEGRAYQNILDANKLSNRSSMRIFASKLKSKLF